MYLTIFSIISQENLFVYCENKTIYSAIQVQIQFIPTINKKIRLIIKAKISTKLNMRENPKKISIYLFRLK
jgi:hypothetical protein